MTDGIVFTTHVLSSSEIARDTLAFTLTRPTGFVFAAGQYVSLKLQDFLATEEDDGERMLSIASAPHDDHLVVAMRMRDSAFKRRFRELKPHEPVTLSPAMGDLLIGPDVDVPVILIAGGIGITPFYAIIRDLEFRLSEGIPCPTVTLLYGNRSPETCAWRDELDQTAARYGQIDVIHIFSDADISEDVFKDSTARRGVVDSDVIRSLTEYRSARYFVVGPPAMVAAVQDCLEACDVPWDQVTVEFFAGY